MFIPFCRELKAARSRSRVGRSLAGPIGRAPDSRAGMVWLNPVPEAHWTRAQSIGRVRHFLGVRMYPLTPDGLEAAAKELSRQDRKACISSKG